MIERETTVSAGGVRLAGSLSLPSGDVRFPAVLMIHGSGPADRDENARQLKFIKVKLNIFNTIARYLADRGVASLRYDKMGCGRSTGDYSKVGLHDLVGDATAMYDYLSSQDRIDPARVFLLGHSEGTYIAPKIAAEHPEIAGLILLAPGVRNLEFQLRYQAKLIREDVQSGGGFIRFAMRLAWRVVGDPERVQSIALDRVKSTTSDSFRLKGQRLNARWMREHLNDDPEGTMRRVACPILSISGEKDIQVHPVESALISGLARGEVEYHVVPGLTHILRQDPDAPSILNYKKLIKKDMDPSVLELIGEWLERRLSHD